MIQLLDKRTADSRLYNIDCTRLLLNGATIASISPVLVDQGNLVFGTASVNSVPMTFPDGSAAAIGCVILVNISAGTLPVLMPFMICTLRAVFMNSMGETLEATVQLRLVNTPGI
jgi:hypothetical protein